MKRILFIFLFLAFCVFIYAGKYKIGDIVLIVVDEDSGDMKWCEIIHIESFPPDEDDPIIRRTETTYKHTLRFLCDTKYSITINLTYDDRVKKHYRQTKNAESGGGK